MNTPDNNASDNGSSSNDQALVLYEKDIQLREQEIILRGKEINNSHDYAMAVLKAQERDEERKRVHADTIHGRNTKSGAFMFLALLIFAGSVIYFDKGNILLEIIKYLLVGMGSYFWGKSKGKAS